MARPLRIEYPGAWYHVLNRGLGKKQIFISPKDRLMFLDIVGEAVEVFKIEVHAYVLMGNHYHLLIHTPHGGLGRAMRHVGGVYTQKFNLSQKTDGPLFRGRYKAKLVDADEYFLELIRYIHMNPVAAGLVARPDAYKWSSHRAYMSLEREPKWLERRELLGYFSANKRKGITEFDRFVRSSATDSFAKAVEADSVIVGSEGFRQWVYDNFMDKNGHNREVPARYRSPRRLVSCKRIMFDAAFVCGVSTSDLRSSRRGTANKARWMAAYLMRRLGGKSYKEIAKYIAAKNEYTVAKMEQRFKENLLRDRGLRLKMEGLYSHLMSQVKT